MEYGLYFIMIWPHCSFVILTVFSTKKIYFLSRNQCDRVKSDRQWVNQAQGTYRTKYFNLKVGCAGLVSFDTWQDSWFHHNRKFEKINCKKQ